MPPKYIYMLGVYKEIEKKQSILEDIICSKP